jgi:hypothetical protein
MPIVCSWLDPAETIIFNQYDGEWTLEEHYDNLNNNYALTAAKPTTRFDVVVVIEAMPKMNYSLSHGMRVVTNPRPNLGLIVMVTQNNLARSLIRILMQLNTQTRKHYRIVGTVGEAKKLIAHERAKANSVTA